MDETKQEFPFTVGLFTPADAQGVGDLFRAVYGEQYPVKLYYHPAQLVDAFKKGDVLPFVAKKDDGSVIGCVAMFRTAPFERLYESGSGIVLPQYRGHHVISQLMAASLNMDDLQALNLAGVWGEAVANHVFMQKIVPRLGYREVALEVDLMPAEAYEQEKSAAGRVGSVVVFRTVASRPHTVYLPGCYDEELRFLYQGMDDDRTLAPAHDQTDSCAGSRLKATVFEYAQVGRIAIESIGTDLSQALRAREEELQRRHPIQVFQAWVNLSCPWSALAVEALRDRGYFLGGLLPRWFDDDGLLMQKILVPPSWDGLTLYSERAKSIYRLVRADWETTQ